jgi:hypothetical protein
MSKLAAAHDFGRVLNPLGIEGQVECGVVIGPPLAPESVYRALHGNGENLFLETPGRAA